MSIPNLTASDEEPTPDDRLRREVQALYRDLEAAVAAAGPVCELSGRCCRFEEYGHTLFLSETEFQVMLSEAPPPVRPFEDGGHCPWQDQRGRCLARESRPLACRVFYCDPNYQERAAELSAQFIGRLKDLADRQGLDWNYARLHDHLRRACVAGEPDLA